MERYLYMIPSTLGESSIKQVLPDANIEIINSLQHFVVEEVRTARRFLIRCGYKMTFDKVRFYELNEHSDGSELSAIFEESGNANLGMISEAGVPAVADPGAILVEEAQRRNVKVIPLTGPSSIILALMASGLNGQNFAFNGYLPVKTNERVNKLRFLEKRSELDQQTQIFIETPYRNNQLIKAILECCKPGTRFCIAANLTLPEEWIQTHRISEWKINPPPDLHRRPAVFLIQA
jgi:16S rRNA (cytidine1402-2'-O)-methyltransferase